MSRSTRWYSKFQTALCLMICVLLMSSCRNAFRDFGDRTSDEYLIAQTKYLIDDFNFDGAIVAITPVLSTQPNNPDVVYLASAAHAGKAGLRVLDLFAAIASDASTKGLIQIFAEHFTGADDDDIASLQEAIDIIENYDDDASTRGSKLNFYSIFLYFGRIGVITSRYALASDGTLNPDFDNCHKVVATSGQTGIPSASIDQIIDSFLKLPGAITYSGSSAFSDVTADITGLVTAPIPSCADDDLGGGACLVLRTILGSGPADIPASIGFDMDGTTAPNTCGAVTP